MPGAMFWVGCLVLDAGCGASQKEQQIGPKKYSISAELNTAAERRQTLISEERRLSAVVPPLGALLLGAKDGGA